MTRPDSPDPSREHHFLIPDVRNLRRAVARATGLERVNIDRLYRLVEPDPKRPKRHNYDLHWALIYLLDRTPLARRKAREAVWTEAMDGGPANRPGHAWDAPTFFDMHLWISAAMAAHIAVALDWLAVEGVFDSDEIAAMGRRFVDGFWHYIHPHAKGHSLHYCDPINQDSAMITGCLVIGYLFGTKWMNDPRARRMYHDARLWMTELMERWPESDFDGDGFTYSRTIHPPCLALSAMTIQEVEGIDYYNAEHGPHRSSVARSMERLQRWSLPSGYSFPHGRYGYVKKWNMYSQALAARKTGQAHYLERALASTQTSFISPWIPMDIPLAVVLTPYGNAEGSPRTRLRPSYTSWHERGLWLNLGSPKARIHAHLCWREGALPTTLLEQDGNRCVVHLSKGSDVPNGMSFPELTGSGRRGTDIRRLTCGPLQIGRVEATSMWKGTRLKRHQKVLAVLDNGTVVLVDWFAADRPLRARHSLTTFNAITRNRTIPENRGAPVHVYCNVTSSEAHTQPVNANGGSGIPQDPVRRTTWPLPRAQTGVAANLFGFGKARLRLRERNRDGLSWSLDGNRWELSVNPAHPTMRNQTIGRTDAEVVLSGSDVLCLLGVRRLEDGGCWLWSTKPVDIAHVGTRISVAGLENFSQFLHYRSADVDLAVLRGGGYTIYVSTRRRLELRLPALPQGGSVQINGTTIPARNADEGLVLKVSPCGTRSGRKPSARLRSALKALDRQSPPQSRPALDVLDMIRTEYRSDMLDIPRQLLSHSDRRVRLAAAETIGWLGAPGDASLVGRRLATEAKLVSHLNGLDAPWHGKWGHFPSVALMADALRRLGNPAVLPVLKRAQARQSEPHALGSIRMAIEALSPR